MEGVRQPQVKDPEPTYLGLYDPNVFWCRNDWRTELDLNLAFIDEVLERYAGSPAFGGCYLPHETTDPSLRILDLNTALARRVKQATPGLPVLTSPFFIGRSDLRNGTDLRSRPRDPVPHFMSPNSMWPSARALPGPAGVELAFSAVGPMAAVAGAAAAARFSLTCASGTWPAA